MAEFDEKLNSILSNPDAMSQIMQLAQSLGGEQPPPPPKAQPAPSLSGLMGSMDPAMLTKLLPLVQELGGSADSNARQLLHALKPYLKPDRQEKIERALQLARLFHLGKKFLSEWEG